MAKPNRRSRFARALPWLFTALFGVAGVQHFRKPEPFDTIVPPQLPGSARDYTYASGVAELAVAALLACPRSRRWGSRAAEALLYAVWPGNIYMAWLWRDETPLKKLIAFVRVPLQILLIRGARRLR